MATFDGSDMKARRQALHMSAADMAEKISCDTTTVFRYESGKLKPNPDVMYEICRVLEDTRLWQDWMRTEYPRSYGREHPAPVNYDLPGSILSLYALTGQIEECRQRIFEDAADGRIDNNALRSEIMALSEKLISTAQAVRTLLPKGGEGDA